MGKLKFVTPLGDVIAEVRRDLSPKTVESILEILPMKYKVIIQRWGEEIFFFLPDSLKTIERENARTELEVGDVAYWPRDPACCIFSEKLHYLREISPWRWSQLIL